MKKILGVFISLMMVVAILPSYISDAKAYCSRTRSQAIAWCNAQVGKSIEVDGAYYYQCVDLIMAYYQYLGAARPHGNANDYTWNTLPAGWARIRGAHPQKGDILVYTNNSYGHVAIYESDTVSYHQNVGGNYVRKITGIRYDRIVGGYWGVIRPDFKAESTKMDPSKALNLGNSFYGNIRLTSVFRPIIYNPDGLYLKNASFKARFWWHFQRQSDGSYIIQNMYDNRCLDVVAMKDADHVRVQCWTRNNSNAQRWYIYKYDNGYRFVPKCAMGRALDACDAKTAEGTRVQIYQIHNNPAQRWTIEFENKQMLPLPSSISMDADHYISPGQSQTINAAHNVGKSKINWSSSDNSVATVNQSGVVTANKLGTAKITATSDYNDKIKATCNVHVIESGAFSDDFYAQIKKASIGKPITNNGTQLSLKEEGLNVKNIWHFQKQSDGAYIIQNVFDQKCMDVSNGTSKNAARVQPYQSNKTKAQKWYIYKNGDGYRLVAECALMRSLDTWGNGDADGTPLQTYKSSESKAQRFSIEVVDQSKIPENLTIDERRDLKVGEEQTIASTLKADELNWTSSDNSVVTVDTNGKIKGIKAGSATITATSKVNEKVTKICTIHVNDDERLRNEFYTKISDTEGKVFSAVDDEIKLDEDNDLAKNSWKFERQDDGSYIISSLYTDKVIKLTTDEDSNKKVVLEEKSDDDLVRWFMTKSGSGYILVPKSDLKSAITISNEGIGLADNNASASQIVNIDPFNKNKVPTSLTVQDNLKMNVGNIAIFDYSFDDGLSDNGWNKVKFSIDNDSIAKVNKLGVVSALSAGEADVTVTSVYNDKILGKCHVVVTDSGASNQDEKDDTDDDTQDAKVEKVELNSNKVKLDSGSSFQLSAKVTPTNAKNNSVTWSTNDESVVKVDEYGMLTAVKAGTATITAKAGDQTDTCEVTVSEPQKVETEVEEITLSQDRMYLDTGSTLGLIAKLSPDEASTHTVKWSSEDENIAKIDDSGTVTAVKAGTTKVTAEADGKKAECSVFVKEPEKDEVKVQSISLMPSELTFKPGDTLKLMTVVTPDDATHKDIIWDSDDEKVVSVDQSGTIKAIKEGTAIITAYAGEFSDSCKVTVNDPNHVKVESISGLTDALTFTVGQSYDFHAEVEPANATNKEIKWASDNENVVKVDQDGKITCLAAGTVVITASAEDKVAKCTVTVNAAKTDDDTKKPDQKPDTGKNQPTAPTTPTTPTTPTAPTTDNNKPATNTDSSKEAEENKPNATDTDQEKDDNKDVKKNQKIFVRATAKGKNKIKLSWTEIDDADEYWVYTGIEGKKLKLVSKVDGHSTTLKKLKKYKIYSIVVKAVTEDKTIIGTNVKTYCITGNKCKNYTNAKALTVSPLSLKLRRKKSKRLKVKVTKCLSKKKAYGKTEFESSNSKIATVSSSGKVKAKGKGKCQITVYTINGIKKVINVTVK